MRNLELIARSEEQAERAALADGRGTWTYGDLLDRSASLAAVLLDGRHDLQQARVLLLAWPGIDFVAGLFAIWRAGGVAVPVSVTQPPAEWAYAAADSRASFAVVASSFAGPFQPVALAAHLRVVPCEVPTRGVRLPELHPDRAALVLYTSGTTSQPKGAVLTHAALQAQVESLVEAWGWRADDRLLHVLPLNHTHGLVNALLCPLWSGAVSELAPGFDAAAVWARLASGEITVFMAVPTMYQRLIAAWEAAGPADRRGWADGARALRLTVSGSAALPVPVFERWRQISGQALLERYGMTEIGMALSNPLSGDRRPGTVGVPLPGVEVRVVAEDGGEAADGEPGEIVVRSPGAFREYWDRPAETAAAWLADGWFSTGDVAVRTDGVVRILGRRSVDIIKTGGEKVSALEIEDVLRTHPAVQDCAVVGLPDEEWGECVTAAVVPQAGAALALDDLRDWARARLAPAKLPRRLVVVADLPRSPLGKVSKPELVRMLAGPPASA